MIRRADPGEHVACRAVYAAACEWLLQRKDGLRTMVDDWGADQTLIRIVEAAQAVLHAVETRAPTHLESAIPFDPKARIWVPVSRALADRLARLDERIGPERTDECFERLLNWSIDEGA